MKVSGKMICSMVQGQKVGQVKLINLRKTDGTTFKGLYEYGKKNGKGVLSFADGSQYDGFFEDDII